MSEKVYLGRPVIHDNNYYGKGVHDVDHFTAIALKNKGAQAMNVTDAAEGESLGDKGLTPLAPNAAGASTPTGSTEGFQQQPPPPPLTPQTPPNGAQGAEGEQGKSANALSGEIPTGFPGKDKLNANGMTQLEQLAGLKGEDLEKTGISKAVAARIIEARDAIANPQQ